LTPLFAEAIVHTHLRSAAYPDGMSMLPKYFPGDGVQYVQAESPHVTDASNAGVGSGHELALAPEYQPEGQIAHACAPARSVNEPGEQAAQATLALVLEK
jgi:hypothetical protein